MAIKLSYGEFKIGRRTLECRGGFFMNKKLILSGILAVALIFSLAGCGGGSGGGDPPGGIDTKWQGKYSYGDLTNYVILGPTSGSYRIGSDIGSIPNITMGTGGTITGNGATGTWAYVCSEGNNFGFVWEVTGSGIYGAFGYGGVNQHLTEAAAYGLIFTPVPSTAGMNPSNPWLSGDKQ
jgi:hypothetical protein